MTNDTQDVPVIELRDWAYLDNEDGEAVIRLSGQVFGDPRRADGKNIETTPIVKVDGRLITTRSGTRYRLGTVHPWFRKHLDATRPLWDPDNPIEMGGDDA